MNNDELARLLQVATSQGTRDTWGKIRGTAIVFGLLAGVIGAGLIYVVFKMLPIDGAENAAIVGGIIGYLAGMMQGFVQIAHLRADESKPQMDVETALAFARLLADKASSEHDRAMGAIENQLPPSRL